MLRNGMRLREYECSENNADMEHYEDLSKGRLHLSPEVRTAKQRARRSSSSHTIERYILSPAMRL